MKPAPTTRIEQVDGSSQDWTVRTLRPSEQKLVYLIYEVGFGRIENLLILAGEPRYEPPPTVTQTIKLDASGTWCPPVWSDFKLKAPFVCLFNNTRTYVESTFVQITINGGLPTQMQRRMDISVEANHRIDGFGLTSPHAN